MKSTYFALGIIIFVIAFTIAGSRYMTSVSDNMLKMCDNVDDGDFEKLEKYWMKNQKLIMAVSNHKNAEEINYCIARFKSYKKGGDEYKHDALSEFSTLKALIRDMAEYERLNLSNIF